MVALRYALVLFAAFSLSLSFALPTEDLPETAYDESEAVPYGITPQSSIRLQQAARAHQFYPMLPLDLCPRFSHDVVWAGWELTTHFISGSLIILVHFLRC